MAYPLSAIVGQAEMKLGILIAAVDPAIGGVLILGDRGSGKSTAVRGLAALLPKMIAVVDCRYGCDPADEAALCAECRERRLGGRLPTHRVPVPVVDLPLGATEDRVVGALDLEKALTQGVKAFETGLLARAHRGFLYIDEVNLLEDHLVDLLLDVAQSGENVVEREGLSIRHPARFVLVGTGNPEEGELRPQLLDRFGLSVEVRTPTDLADRVAVVRSRDGYDRDPAGFAARHADGEAAIATQILAARDRFAAVAVPDAVLEMAARLCMALGTDGLRGELTLMRAARAAAALDGGRRGDAGRPEAGGAARPAPSPAPQSARRVGLQCPHRPRGGGSLRRMSTTAAAPWRRAVSAAALLAIDPALGGVCVRAAAGPLRDAWLAALRAMLPPDVAWRRMPSGIAEGRLLGGLDLAATLAAGRPVAERGLLAAADGGIVVVPMAERLAPRRDRTALRGAGDGGRRPRARRSRVARRHGVRGRRPRRRDRRRAGARRPDRNVSPFSSTSMAPAPRPTIQCRRATRSPPRGGRLPRSPSTDP